MISSVKVEVNEHLVEIRPCRKINIFRYLAKDNDIDTTIFLFHGSMASYKQFNGIINYLKEKFPVNIIAFDALGCGRSEKSRVWEDYSSDELFLDALEVFNRYSTNKNILIGHSYGTTHIAKLAQNSSSKGKIFGAILLGTAWKIDGRHPIFWLPETVLECLSPHLSAEFSRLAYSPSTNEEIKLESASINQANDMYVCRAFYQQFTWASNDDWVSLRNIPVFILHGKDDLISAEDDALKLYDELQFNSATVSEKQIFLPNDKIVANQSFCNSFKIVEAAGHMLMLEQPDIVNELIEDYLRGLLLL